ncbi:hypothetical protein LTS18_004763, partial [Coniosporium uncinatum]
MPDSNTMAFGLLLGINRERQSFERMVASRVENNWNQQFQASMLAHDKDQEIYMISLWIPGKESSEDWQTIIPELETRVKVIVFWGQRKYTFHGEVMEDIFGIGGHITCGVRAKDSSMHKLHFWQDRTVEAELVFVSDATAFNRFENTTRVVMDSIESVVGGTFVCGAGGTGKTAVAMTTAAAHMFWNNEGLSYYPKRRIAVTGPSNESVDEDLRQLVQIAASERELHELVAVRFTGANYGRRAQRARAVQSASAEDGNEAEEGGEHANSALYDMLKRVVEDDGAHDAGYDFEVQKEAWMDR